MAADSKIHLMIGGFISFLKVHAWDYACAKIGKHVVCNCVTRRFFYFPCPHWACAMERDTSFEARCKNF